MASGEDLQPAAVRDLLDQIVARTVAGMGAYAGALFLLEPGGEVLVLDASFGMPTGFVSLLRRIRVAAVPEAPLPKRSSSGMWCGSVPAKSSPAAIPTWP